MLEDILNWLEQDGRPRASRDVENMFHIATDIGAKRGENQDRVAVLKVSTKSQSFVCACVCDGMGGLKDGGKAATLALGTFFSSLVTNRRLAPELRLDTAAKEASSSVAAEVAGGGSTLSAILIEGKRALTINVGDSRIFQMPSQGDMVRLTVDDTMEEAYGAEGRGLLQFIGMKSGLKPHINPVPQEDASLVITTDGAHLVGEQMLGQLRANASNRQTFSERVLNVANWIGGIDNATIVVTAPLSELVAPKPVGSSDISVWSPVGRLKIAWASTSHPQLSSSPITQLPDENRQRLDEAGYKVSPDPQQKVVAEEPKPTVEKKPVGKIKRRDKKAQIEIGFSDEEGTKS